MTQQLAGTIVRKYQLPVAVLLILASLRRRGQGRRASIGDRIVTSEFKASFAHRRTLDDFGPRKAFEPVAVRTTCPLAVRYLPVPGRSLQDVSLEKGVQFLAAGGRR